MSDLDVLGLVLKLTGSRICGPYPYLPVPDPESQEGYPNLRQCLFACSGLNLSTCQLQLQNCREPQDVSKTMQFGIFHFRAPLADHDQLLVLPELAHDMVRMRNAGPLQVHLTRSKHVMRFFQERKKGRLDARAGSPE